MLTPAEISGKEFEKAVFGGYSPQSVDDFIGVITSDYAALYKENAILKQKIKVLVEKVEEYRSTEDAMRAALLTAQKTGETILDEAARRSEALLADTENEIHGKLRELAALQVNEEKRLQLARLETARFIEDAEAMLDRHREFLSSLEEITPVEDLLNDEPPPQFSQPEPPPQSPPVPPPVQAANGIEPFLEDKSETFEEDDEPTSPRPKFDYENLKFGINFEQN